MKDYKALLKDIRIILFFATIILSIVAIQPTFSYNQETGTYELSTAIKKGIDLSGGVEALLLPEEPTLENAQLIAKILENRISSFGLKEAKINLININDSYYVDIAIAGATEKELRELVEKQGVFEAYVGRVSAKDEHGLYLLLDGKKYYFEIVNSTTILFNDSYYGINSTFYVDGFKIKINQINNDSVRFLILGYSGSEVKNVLHGAQYSSITQTQDGGYKFMFTVILSQEAADRMATITKDMGVVSTTYGKAILDEKLEFYLDGNLTDVLTIDAGLKGSRTTTVQITGYGATEEEAYQNMKKMQAILQSGSFPVKVKIVDIYEISPTLSKNFLKLAVYAIIAALILISVVIYLRYRDPKIILPMIATSLTEVLAIFGFAAAIGWTIDLAAIAGIVAAVGTGIDDQIIVIDESKRKQVKESLRLKLKKAFFIIFASAATTIGAMLPLLVSSFANVKGFAFTTIVGVLIGVLITRPAFSRVVKFLNQ